MFRTTLRVWLREIGNDLCSYESAGILLKSTVVIPSTGPKGMARGKTLPSNDLEWSKDGSKIKGGTTDSPFSLL